MITLLCLCAALQFYVEPVVFRASFETYRSQVQELQDAIAGKEKALDSLLAAGQRAAADELELQIAADQELLKTHAEFQQMIDQRGYFYLEFEIEIPYRDLTYREENKQILADIRIVLKLMSIERPDSLTDTLYYRYSIPSFSEAVRQEPTFADQFGLFIPSGRYEYAIEVTSGENRDSIRVPYEIDADDYGNMSGLLVASRITDDTTGGYFNKGGLKVYPRASKLFNEQNSTLFVYYELYGLDSSDVVATYELLDSTGKVLRRSPQRLSRLSPFHPVNFGISTLGIATGDYQFRVQVTDSAAVNITRSTTVRIERKARKEVSFEGLPYYEEIEYFVSDKKYREFKKLDPEGKSIFLKKLWQELDYPAIARRFEEADTQFKEGALPGHKTDRGRVYVKFGPPDEIKRETMQQKESRPFEQWAYYSGSQFVFVDIRATHEYTLVWTNDHREKNQPTLYQFLPEELLRAINKDENPTFQE